MIDLEALRQEIRGMTRKTLLYKVLKEELNALGYWKLKDRGIAADKIGSVKAPKGYGSVEGGW